MATVYDPSNQYEIKVWDVEFRRDPVRTLMARVYQPQGDGPFPALLDPEASRRVHAYAFNANVVRKRIRAERDGQSISRL